MEQGGQGVSLGYNADSNLQVAIKTAGCYFKF